jgi:hypothetical protein
MRPQLLAGFGLTMQVFSHGSPWKPADKTANHAERCNEVSCVMRMKEKAAGKAEMTGERKAVLSVKDGLSCSEIGWF